MHPHRFTAVNYSSNYKRPIARRGRARVTIIHHLRTMCILSDVECNYITTYVYLLQSATVTATVATYALSMISVVPIYFELHSIIQTTYNTTITRGNTAAAIP